VGQERIAKALTLRGTPADACMQGGGQQTVTQVHALQCAVLLLLVGWYGCLCRPAAAAREMLLLLLPTLSWH
jgi:hypothetical protein